MRSQRARYSSVFVGFAVLAACSSDGGSSATSADETSSTVASVTTTAAPTTTLPATTTATTAPPTTAAPTTTAATTTTVSPDVPGKVSGVDAYPGGGSGEVQIDWDAEDGATGYRVTIASSPDGPFEVIADFNITTGAVSVAAEVVNIWSSQHTYVPGGGSLSGTDTSSEFYLVDYSGAGERCFHVIAYNEEGRGRASSVACSGPL